MRYQYILFDADNTLFDFDAAQRLALFETLEISGIKPLEEYLESYNRINLIWWKRLERAEVRHDRLGVGRFEDFLEQNMLSGDPSAMNDLYRKHLGQHGIMLPGAYETIQALYGKCQLYIITNGMAVTQHSRFDSSPLRFMINDIFISQEIGAEKPSAQYFELVLEKIRQRFPSLEKNRCLIVGDSLSSDIKGANNIGIDSVLYDPKGKYTASSEAQSKPDYVIHELGEIVDIVA